MPNTGLVGHILKMETNVSHLFGPKPKIIWHFHYVVSFVPDPDFTSETEEKPDYVL